MIRRIGTLIIATVLLLTVFTFSATGSQAFAASQAKVNAGYLNIREKPTTSSKAIGYFKRGQVVNIIQQQKGWSKVSFGKQSGWVSSSYLTMVTKAPAKPAAAKPEVARATKYYVTAGSLNIRKEPNTSSAVVTIVKKDEAVTLFEKKDKWGKVKTASGKSGWASLSFLTTKIPAKPAVPAAPVTANPPVSAPGKNYVVVKQNGTNIRNGPASSYSILTSEKAGATLEKISVDNGWIKVKTKSGKTGWVANWLVTSSVKGVKGKTIVIDPGHGGTDPGAVGKNKTQEKVISLQTANELKVLLQKAGAKVIMTRTSNTSRKLELSERVAISHKYNADVFISIHYNSGSNTATGIETYYDTKYGNEAELAKFIQTELIKQTGMNDRRVKTEEFYVIYNNEIPSVLVELGFISNPNEEKIIATKAYQQKAAKGIFNGLDKYFKL